MIDASGLRRSARLLALPAGTAGDALSGALRRRRGEDPARVSADLRQRSAARTRRVLGELKGGALKAGQLLSTVSPLLPQDPEDSWGEALRSLQEDAGALPFVEVEPVLRAELGPGWRTLFGTFEERATAAASLGQVHRATWAADGRDVAVKVQYPGVREALRSDLRTLSLLTRGAALVARGLTVPPLLAEMRTRLLEELDYRHEAEAQEAVRTGFTDDPEVVVPAVVHATSRVLVTTWLEGTPLARLARTADQAERDRVGALYQRFLVSGPERAGRLHTDPHPGNFRVLPDGRLGVLDFGSTLRLPGMPPEFGRLLAALAAADGPTALRRLREAGFVRPGRALDVDALLDYMAPFTVPAAHERWHFTRAWLRREFARANDPRNPDFAVAARLDLPAEHLFTHRVWLGMVGVLCSLEAEVPVRPVLARWLPGFAGSEAA